MRRLSTETTFREIAEKIGLSYSSIQKLKAEGAPIRDMPAFLEWWRANKRTAPPGGLIAAAAEDGEAPPEIPPVEEEESIEGLDIEQAVEAQRQNFAILQRHLKLAQKSNSHTLIELWQGRIDKSAHSLARLEKIAKEVRDADKRWLPVDTLRQVWNDLHQNLNERLYEVAAHPDRSTLRQRWDAAVAKLLEDPFS